MHPGDRIFPSEMGDTACTPKAGFPANTTTYSKGKTKRENSRLKTGRKATENCLQFKERT